MSKPTVPVDVVTDLRARLAKGKEEVDRGRYALARQAFRSALKAVDSVIIEYLDSDTLRRIRGEIDAADRQALRACQAENDAIRKRGATLLSCD
jgi:hypothetical protein